MPLRGPLFAVILVAVLCHCAPRGRNVAFRDAHPLPAEPLRIVAPSIGVYGGRFVIAQTSGPKVLNPLVANETSTSDVTSRLFTGLADFDNLRQTPGPLLAKTWETSADGLTWTFRLRRGAAFSDGHPITADDVLFSFRLAYDPVVNAPVQALLRMDGQPFTVTAPDSYTVVIKTPKRNALLVPIASAVRVMPKHVLEPAFLAGRYASAYGVGIDPESLVTSGPWRLKQYVPGEKTVLARNPYWFGVDAQGHRLPYLDELVFLIVPDQDAADLKFRAGEVDAVDNVKPENYKWYEENQKQGSFTLYDLGPGLNTNFFWFNLNKMRKVTPGKKLGSIYVDPVKYAWFNDARFRRAMSMAIDRDAMVRSVFFGDAVKSWSTTTPGNKEWHSPDVVGFDYDVTRARRILADMGWKDADGDGVIEDTRGNEVAFALKTNSDNKSRVALGNFVRDDLAKVGVKVTLVPVEFNTLVSNMRENLQYEAILGGLQTGVPPDPAMGQNVWRSSGRAHYWNLEQPEPETPEEAHVDRLVDENLTTLEPDARRASWRQMQDIMNDRCWFIWLPAMIVRVPVRDRFGNVQPSVIPHRILWNVDRIYAKSGPGR